MFYETWDDFQFSFLGANSFTEIHNGPDARIKGVEMDLTYNGGGLFFNVLSGYPLA